MRKLVIESDKEILKSEKEKTMFNTVLKESDVSQLNENIPARIGTNLTGAILFYLPGDEFGGKKYGLTVDRINEKLILFRDEENGNKCSVSSTSPRGSISFGEQWHGFNRDKIGKMKQQMFTAIVHDNGKIEFPFPDFDLRVEKTRKHKKDQQQATAKVEPVIEKAPEVFNIEKTLKKLNSMAKSGEVKFIVNEAGLIGYSKNQFIIPE